MARQIAAKKRSTQKWVGIVGHSRGMSKKKKKNKLIVIVIKGKLHTIKSRIVPDTGKSVELFNYSFSGATSSHKISSNAA